MGSIKGIVFSYIELATSGKLFGSFAGNPIYTKELDEAGNQAFNTIFGEGTVAERKDTFNVTFQYNNNDGYSTNESLTGTGTTSNLNERARVHTGAGIGSAKIKSRRAVRYITRHECLSMFTSIYTIPEENTYQMHLYGENGQDGIGYGFDNQVFGIWLILRGVKTHRPISEWSKGLPNGFVLDPHSLNVYGVMFGWLGIAPIIFKIYCGIKHGWKTVHVEDLTNTQQVPHLSNASLPISIEVGRTVGTGADLILGSASWGAGIVGSGGAPEDRYVLEKRLNSTFSATVYQSIVSFKSKLTYQAKPNNVRTFSNLGNKDLDIDFYRENGTNDGVLTGGTFVDIDTYGSTLQYNNAATSYVPGAGSKLIGNTLVQPNTLVTRINLLGQKDVELDIVAGETLHVVVLGANNGTLKSTIRMSEQF